MGISVRNVVVRAWFGERGGYDPTAGCDFGQQVKKGWEALLQLFGLFWRQTHKRSVYNPIHRTIALNGVTILRNVECTATTPQNWRQSWSLWSRPMWQNQLRHDPCDLWPTTHHRLLKNFIRHNKNSNGKFKKKQKKRKYNDNATPILCVANAYTTIGLLCCTDLARWCYCHNYANYY